MSFPLLKEYECHKCGKIFIPAAEHIYKSAKDGETRIYCSWTCYNNRDVGNPQRHYKRVVQSDMDGNDIRTYSSANNAACHVGGKPDGVRKAIRNGTTYRKFLWRYADE